MNQGFFIFLFGACGAGLGVRSVWEAAAALLGVGFSTGVEKALCERQVRPLRPGLSGQEEA
ncbi:hypothetical protein KDK_48660 [Dictyobacter kobayashii]|uniref:Uncharacterized protein n=1 Tax=Dictyobacter kobayashii TaxID=2014872 RepID=A0A402APM1_9CHLR|nr:hypothetical protein KDK_48660 [Dictyobacter kobayashii]